MSSELSFYDFEKESKSWVDAFGEATHEQRVDFYDILKHEFARLKYLKVRKGVVKAKGQVMLLVTSEFNVSVRHTELVMIDFAKVWSDFVAADQTASHFFDLTTDGFCFNFALRSRKGFCIVGQVQTVGVRS